MRAASPNDCIPTENCTQVYQEANKDMSGNNTYLAVATPCLLECFIPYNCNATLPSNLQPNATLPELGTFNPISPYQGSICRPKKFEGCKIASDPGYLQDIANKTNFSNTTIIFMKSKVNCTMVIFECKSICIPEQINNTATNHTNATDPTRRLLEQEIKNADTDDTKNEDNTDVAVEADNAGNPENVYRTATDNTADEHKNEREYNEQKNDEANTYTDYQQDGQGEQNGATHHDQSSASADLLGTDVAQMYEIHG